MSNRKKVYYWLKLKTDFFNRSDIDFILSQKNGCQYIVIYQMLLLKVINSNGVLASSVNGVLIPFDTDKIVRELKYFDIDTINIALALYQKIGLVYYEKDKNLYKMSEINDLVGIETNYAIEKRKYRRKIVVNCLDDFNKIPDDNF